MSRIGIATKGVLSRVFSLSNTNECYRSSTYVHPDLNYLNNNVFNLFLNVDCTGPHIAVPLLCRGYVERELNNNTQITGVNIALFSNSVPIIGKTGNSAIKIFMETSFSQRLTKIITRKEEVYYGGRGIILDKDRNPIFLCTLEGEISEEGLTYNVVRIYINPSVFISENTLEKTIIKTVIPYYAEYGVSVFFSYSHIHSKFTRRRDNRIIPEIVIKDFTNDFFIKPAKPKPSTFTRDEVNNFLLEHIEDIKSMSGL